MKRKNANIHRAEGTRRTKSSEVSSRKNSRTQREKNLVTKSGPASSKNTVIIVVFVVIFAALVILSGNFLIFQEETKVSPLADEKEDVVLPIEKQGYKKEVPSEKQDYPEKKHSHKKEVPDEKQGYKKEVPDKQQDDRKDGFKGNFLTKISIQSAGLPVVVQELKHHNDKSSVKAYLINGLLTPYECDQLIRVHKRHTEDTNLDPILCFSEISTLRKHLKYANVDIKVSEKDFVYGTKCLNESFSVRLKPHFKWSSSTAFYPGESKFSSLYAERIEKVTGMPSENGGKFQITSYPNGVAYKNHTDCVLGSSEKRDRFATILVYLQDVEKGGETHFPELGIKVKPQKGYALVWNSMDANGHCDPTSIHNSSHVEMGHKFIIQRWYYYKSFPSLGKRVAEPQLPPRKPQQPRVTCDEYEFGSCRWYDEWNYDHLTDYPYG